MRTLAVVEGEIFAQANHQFPHRGVALQIHVLMLDVTPQPFNKNVVERSPPSIHADDHVFSLEDRSECIAGELRSLIAVEDLRFAVSA